MIDFSLLRSGVIFLEMPGMNKSIAIGWGGGIPVGNVAKSGLRHLESKVQADFLPIVGKLRVFESDDKPANVCHGGDAKQRHTGEHTNYQAAIRFVQLHQVHGELDDLRCRRRLPAEWRRQRDALSFLQKFINSTRAILPRTPDSLA